MGSLCPTIRADTRDTANVLALANLVHKSGSQPPSGEIPHG